MRRWIVVGAWFSLVAVIAGTWASHSLNGPAGAAQGSTGLFVPGLTKGSSAIATPTPTPTPIGGGGGGGDSGALDIHVSIKIIAREASTDPDGMVDIPINAAATAHLPGPLDQPVTVGGTVTIAPHPVDAAGCTWARTYAKTDFTMTVRPPEPGSNDVSLTFEAPEWHYAISCPEPGYVTRFPAFGEQTMLAFLRYTFPEYAPPAGLPLPVPPVQVAPACFKREATFQRSVDLADATIRIVIYQPHCELPLAE